MSNVIPTNVDEAIARIDEWKGANITYTSLTGGQTNPTYKVSVDDTNYFLKVPGTGTDFINRENCHMAGEIADKAGVGAKVYKYFPDTGVEVFEWLEGYRNLCLGDMYFKDICLAGISAIRDFNNLPGAELPEKVSVFDQYRSMLARCTEADYIPPWHKTYMYYMSRIEDAFKTYGMESKPCHNDYWFANLMWNEEKKEGKIIDLEYASMSDPVFDVAGWMCGFATEDMMKDAVTLYNYGEFDEKLFAKTNLARLASEIKWTYWSIMQTATSTIQFDYYAWYTDKSKRLRYYIVDNRIDYWLNILEGKNSWRTPGIWKTLD
ncbi:MAG: phosphotransferase family protein [Lachnospiraceae bacterium]|nr:phosphotransferase family protein [Lachnospiraceae bacterium]